MSYAEHLKYHSLVIDDLLKARICILGMLDVAAYPREKIDGFTANDTI